MTAMFQTGAGISGPPDKMRQNETPYWQDVPYTDEFDNEYDSNSYTLTYYFGGPVAGLSLVAVPGVIGASGEGWITTFDSGTSGQMTPGLYFWQAVLSRVGPPAVRIVAAEGEITIEVDLATAPAGYDGRSQAEIGLAACELALSTFASTNGRVKEYVIAGRRMQFSDTKEIQDLANWFRGRVGAEKQQASGGNDRLIRIGFAPPSSGTPSSSSKNWPWW